jgi:hypothetical protein
MTGDPNDLEVLVELATEAEAAGIVTALAERDIEASATSGSAFPANLGLEGAVQVLVRRADLDRAKQVLAEIQEEQHNIDWSKIDVGKPDDSDPPPA